MQTFYLLIGKSNLYVYEKKDNTYERLYIEGNPEYAYDLNSTKTSIEQLMDELVNEYNLDTKAEIDFIVVDNEDRIVSEVMQKVLGEYQSKVYEIDFLMKLVAGKLQRDSKMMIDKFGINFDGKNYLLSDGGIVKNDFNLLGYTLNEDDLMKYIR